MYWLYVLSQKTMDLLPPGTRLGEVPATFPLSSMPNSFLSKESLKVGASADEKVCVCVCVLCGVCGVWAHSRLVVGVHP